MNSMILYKQESFDIVGTAMEVHNNLGCGFTEAVYQEAFEKELQLRGIPYEREKELIILYKGQPLEKTFRVDFVCYGKIIVELKALSCLSDEHISQVQNYLKASGYRLGLLINFGTILLERMRLLYNDKWDTNRHRGL